MSYRQVPYEQRARIRKFAVERRAEMKRKALSDAEVRERLKLTPEDFELMERLARSPGRNAATQLGVLKLKVAATVEPPSQRVAVDQAVTVTVKVMKPVGNHTLEVGREGEAGRLGISGLPGREGVAAIGASAGSGGEDD